jgi:hypothetical protein
MGGMRLCPGCRRTMYLSDKGLCRACEKAGRPPTPNELRILNPAFAEIDRDLDRTLLAVGRFYQ